MGVCRIIPLGGLGEVGKNMTVYEADGAIVVVDAGLAFPRDEHLGVDLVLPDFSYLRDREEMVRAVVDGGLSKAAAARKYNTTPKTVAKWVNRFRAEGVDGLRDRSSKPLSSPDQIPLSTADAVERLRRQRCTQE